MYKFLLLAFLLLALNIFGCASTCQSNQTIIGTLYISGNEPFTHLALVTAENEFYKIKTTDSLKKELWKLQGSTVEVNYDIIYEDDTYTEINVSDYKLSKSNK